MEPTAISFGERLDRLVEGFVLDASRRRCGREIAHEAAYSVAQTHRIFKRSYGESPGAFRRRLVLERAAEALRQPGSAVWKVALESGFTSPEAFSRAFRRAFGVTPSAVRAAPEQGAPRWIPSPNAVHFWRGSLLRSMDTGGKKMNIVERLVEHDLVDSRRLMERAQTLTSEELDAPLPDPQPRLFLECFQPTIRGRLAYLVGTKEAWLAAVYARRNPLEDPKRGFSTAEMLERWDKVEAEWRELARSVEAEKRWDEMFIDALCEQPMTFSFGGMIAHVLDQSARQRAELFRAFTAIGHEDVCYGDPLSWEQRSA
jgi:AraC-like DNA-binding protein